jgi:hypothetical protein
MNGVIGIDDVAAVVVVAAATIRHCSRPYTNNEKDREIRRTNNGIIYATIEQFQYI